MPLASMSTYLTCTFLHTDIHTYKRNLKIKTHLVNKTAHYKDHTPIPKKIYSRSTKMIQHIQNNKYNTQHKYNQGQKSHEHFNKC